MTTLCEIQGKNPERQVLKNVPFLNIPFSTGSYSFLCQFSLSKDLKYRYGENYLVVLIAYSHPSVSPHPKAHSISPLLGK